MGALSQNCDFGTRSKIISIISRASKTTLFRRSSRRRSRIAPWGNARMRAPLLLFPKISLRCDFWEPFSAHPCLREENYCASENHAFRKAHSICHMPAAYGKRVNFRPFYNKEALFNRVPENRSVRKHCEIFGKEAKQCRSACGLE